ncbi:MAG: phosphate ABC transporter permease subunit PstC [Acidimicrobiia bacterium]
MNAALPPLPDVAKRSQRGRRFDQAFRIAAVSAAVVLLGLLALIVVSTLNASIPWFRDWGWDSILGTRWVPSDGAGASLEALALIYGSIITSLIALVIAVPLSIGVALFVTEIAPTALRAPVIFVIDLLAVIPSVVFGLWGLNVLAQPLSRLYESISATCDGWPILGTILDGKPVSGVSLMTGGLILSLMATPIVASLSREVVATTPTSLKEAALALGATRWEMMKVAVLAHSRSGLAASALIGLGRALGETIAVVLVVGASARITPALFSSGDTMAAAIARNFNEATGVTRSALIGLGVVLLVVTFVINVSARTIIRRVQSRSAGVAA